MGWVQSIAMKQLSTDDDLYNTAQIADFMEVSQGTVARWARRGELMPTAMMDVQGNKFNPMLMKMRPGGGMMYLFSKDEVRRFLRGRWITGQSWGEGRRKQPGEECPEVLRV